MTTHTPAGGGSDARHPLRLDRLAAAGAGVVSAAWLAVTALGMPYPFTVDGVDARQRDMAFGLGLTLVSVGWLQRARTTRPVTAFVAAYALLAAAVMLLPLVFGYGPFGPLGRAWWNERVTSAVMLALCVAAVLPGSRAPAAAAPTGNGVAQPLMQGPAPTGNRSRSTRRS